MLSISLNFQNLDDFTSKIVFSTDTLTLVSKESKVSIKNFFNYKNWINTIWIIEHSFISK